MRIRITVHGAIYTVIGALLLTNGLLRGELLSAVCGGLLTLYAGFAAAAVAATAFCWKSEEPELASKGSGFTVTSTHSKTAQAEPMKTFPPCIPGTATFYTIDFSLSPESTAETAATLSIPLQGRQTEYYPQNLTRGKYFYKKQYLNIQDFAGFFAAAYMQPLCLSVPYTVVQPVLPSKRTAFPNLRSRAVNNLPSQERTNEVYESRPYFPGDDPRKIHWKLYAHTNALSIKLGAFEPPPIKRLTIYIEEPVVLKKKERALAASVFDAFIGRLSSLIIELFNAGIQCSLLLYDYPQRSLQRYEITEETSAAAAQIQNLLAAVPAFGSSPETLLDAAAVFKAVPDSGGLLYCYMPTAGISRNTADASSHPLPAGNITGTGERIGENTKEKIAVHKKITAFHRSGIETFFCLAAPPLPKDHAVSDSRIVSGTVFSPAAKPAGESISKQEAPAAISKQIGQADVELSYHTLSKMYMHRLLYSSAASARQKAFYRNLQEAAEQELRIFTAGNCHAELL